jgi:hypothetical protein
MKIVSVIGVVVLALGAALAGSAAAHADSVSASAHGDFKSAGPAHSALKPTAAVPAATQHVSRRHHHRRHNRMAVARHDFIARSSTARGVPMPAPAPAHQHGSSQAAGVPGPHHLRAHASHSKWSLRHAASGAWLAPASLVPLGSASAIGFDPVSRENVWRNESRGPPRASPRDNPSCAFTQRPVLTQRPFVPIPGARPASLFARFSTFRMFVRPAPASACAPGVSCVPQMYFSEARLELHRWPFEGTATVPVPALGNGGSS